MGQFIGSSTVEVMGQDIDINDDDKLRAVLREDARKLLAPIPPITAKNCLLDTITDIRLVGIKFAFVMNQSMLMESKGIGIQTCQQIYNQIATIAGLNAGPGKQEIVGSDGNGISSVETPTPDLNLDTLPQD